MLYNCIIWILALTSVASTLGVSNIINLNSKEINCGNISYASESSTINEIAKLDEHPWIVGIAYYDPDFGLTSIDCSGVLISSKHVLTQGSCLNYKEIYIKILSFVRLGDWNISTVIDCSGKICAPLTIDITILETFSQFDPDWPWSDNIGLIKLERDVPFSKFIAPICLPNVNEHQNIKSYTGGSFIVSGWGFVEGFSFKQLYSPTSDIKSKRSWFVDDHTICSKLYSFGKRYDPLTHICSNKTSACQGDGPIMGIDTTDPDHPYWYIFGFFTNTLNNNCSIGVPRLGIQVVPYMDWVISQMKL